LFSGRKWNYEKRNASSVPYMLSSQERNLNFENWEQTATLGSMQMGTETFMKAQVEKYHFWKN
jgi:hypothetical protein